MSSRPPLSHSVALYSTEIASWFEDVPLPVPLDVAQRNSELGRWSAPDLGDASSRVVILAGPESTRDQWALHSLARHFGAPVANTWGAKGIYPWDDVHHMGTCGLQRDDFALLGFGRFDRVIAFGVDEEEVPLARYSLAPTVVVPVDRAAVEAIRATTRQRGYDVGPNQLYQRMAAIAQPGYIDESFPRHPARAVMDLKQSLGPMTRVTAQPGLAGLWVARTFPTDRMGSVVVPALDRPGVGSAVGLVSAAQGTDTVCVVRGPVDAATAEVMRVAEHHELPLRIEVWDDDVDWSRTENLIAAAGPIVAWT